MNEKVEKAAMNEKVEKGFPFTISFAYLDLYL